MDPQGYTVVVLFVLILLFLVFRRVALWYWRINDMHAELTRVNVQLSTTQQRLIEIADLLREARRGGAA